jgi:hypothetical protein
MNVQTITLAPAPWQLSGNGYILLYYFRNRFLEQKGFIADFQKEKLHLRLGAVLMVDYETADVGPYRELMFIPGLFNFGGRRSFSISKIYVSSAESQLNGQQNWGIPKELADFSIQELSGGRTRWIVKKGANTFFDATIKTRSIGLPISSRLFPWSRIVQAHKNRLLLTAPSATGKLKSALVQHISAKSDLFPPIQEAPLLAAFSFQNFRMKFPVPWHIG